MKKYFVTLVVISGISTASALTCTELPKNLSKGAESSNVLALQIFLKDKGYLTVKPNGYYGDGTVRAVKAYQKSLGFAQVGVAGSATRAAVKNESCIVVTKKAPLKETSTNSLILVDTKKVAVEKQIETISAEQFLEIGKDTDYLVEDPIAVGGKLAFVSSRSPDNFIVYDGKEVTKKMHQ